MDVKKKEPMLSRLIKYNLFDRKRKYNGQERHADAMRWLIDAINSKATQERVSFKDMAGFYGHWPRMKLGLNPQEGGIIDGKPVVIEPALRTVVLMAEPNGDVTHQAEFLDNEAGRTAWGLYNQGLGGFSSAIDTAKRIFWGFDFVFEPNYSSNRGHEVPVFDSCMSFDSATIEESQYGKSLSQVAFLLDDFHKVKSLFNETLESQSKEIEDLRTIENDALGQIVKLQNELKQYKETQKAVLGFDVDALNKKGNGNSRAATSILKSSEKQAKEFQRKIDLINRGDVKESSFFKDTATEKDNADFEQRRSAFRAVYGWDM